MSQRATERDTDAAAMPSASSPCCGTTGSTTRRYPPTCPSSSPNAWSARSARTAASRSHPTRTSGAGSTAKACSRPPRSGIPSAASAVARSATPGAPASSRSGASIKTTTPCCSITPTSAGYSSTSPTKAIAFCSTLPSTRSPGGHLHRRGLPHGRLRELEPSGAARIHHGPSGSPASAAALAGVLLVRSAATACARPGRAWRRTSG